LAWRKIKKRQLWWTKCIRRWRVEKCFIKMSCSD